MSSLVTPARRALSRSTLTLIFLVRRPQSSLTECTPGWSWSQRRTGEASA